MFLLDSITLKTALRTLEKLRTDAVEILPGPMAKGAYHAVRNSEPKRTLLAGDSIRSRAVVDDLLSVGFDGVTTSCHQLW